MAVTVIAVTCLLLFWLNTQRNELGGYAAELAAHNHAVSIEAEASGRTLEIHIFWKVGGETDYRFWRNGDGLLLLRGVFVGGKSGKIALVSQNSIPDFAVAARPFATDVRAEWVPQHGHKSGASADVHRLLLIDGKSMSGDFDVREISSFRMVQTFSARNANVSNLPMWDHRVVHEISLSRPYLHISNGLSNFAKTRVFSMNLAMLPAAISSVVGLELGDKVIEPDGNTPVATDFPASISSAMFVSEETAGLAYGAALWAPDRALKGRLTVRDDNVAKVYWDTTGRQTIEPGASFNADQYMVVAPL